jgi:hypothetical protein
MPILNYTDGDEKIFENNLWDRPVPVPEDSKSSDPERLLGYGKRRWAKCTGNEELDSQ